ncbi:zinc finger, CCHC-type, retrotransposon gag domain protein [Tanacetum coccineum]
MKDKVSQEHVCEEEMTLNNNIRKQSGDLVEMPSEAVEDQWNRGWMIMCLIRLMVLSVNRFQTMLLTKMDDVFTEDERRCKEWVVYVLSSITNILDLKLPLVTTLVKQSSGQTPLEKLQGLWFRQNGLTDVRSGMNSKKGIKRCKRWCWNDPELEIKWYITQLYEMHLLLNPSQREELENELTSREELAVLQVEFTDMEGQMQQPIKELKKSQNNAFFWKLTAIDSQKKKALDVVIAKRIGKAMRKAIPYYINETSNQMKEQIRKEFEELKKEVGFMKGSWKDRATYRDFTACDVPKFTGDLNPIASTRWITTVEGVFRTSECEDMNKFKEMFNVEYALVEEIDKIREEFHSLTQTNEMVNELWKKFNDMVPYCPEYHGNEKLKGPDKGSGFDKKEEQRKEGMKRKQEYGDVGAKRAMFDHGKKSSGKQVKSPCNKCHKLHYGECRLNMKGCYTCGDPNHMSRDCRKPMIVCYGCNEIGHKLSECPKAKAIEALRAIKEEKAEAPKAKARAYPMTAEEAQSMPDLVTSIILVNSLPARVLYDSGASVLITSNRRKRAFEQETRDLNVKIKQMKVFKASCVVTTSQELRRNHINEEMSNHLAGVTP